MITFDKVHEIAYEYLRNVSIKRNNGIHASCPFCGDSKKSVRKKRFHIDYYPKYNEYIYHCFNGGCNESGNIYSLYAFFKDISYNEAVKELDSPSYNPSKIKDKLNNKSVKKKNDTVISNDFDIDFNKECLSIDSKPDGRIEERYIKYLKSFIKNRKIDFKCFIATDGKYKNRIIIPVWRGSKIEYFQGRKIFKEQEPKYLNPEVEKENVILNIDNFDKDKYIVTVEGLIDAYNIGNQGTSFLGAVISEDRIKKLLTKTNKGVIIGFDNDEPGKEALLKFIKENKYHKQVKYFMMSFKSIKDINQLVVEKNIKDVYDFIINNSYSYFYINNILRLQVI